MTWVRVVVEYYAAYRRLDSRPEKMFLWFRNWLVVLNLNVFKRTHVIEEASDL